MSYKHLALIILIALTPVLVYGQMFEWVLSPLVPATEISNSLMADPQQRALFAREFPGRVSLALVCLVLGICSIAALIYAVWLIHSKAGAKVAAGLLVLAVGAGAVSFLTNDYFDDTQSQVIGLQVLLNSDRESTGERMRHIAQIPGTWPSAYDPDYQKTALTSTGYIAAMSALFGVAGGAALALVINEVGFGVFGRRERLSPDNLKQRWNQFRTILVFASVIFALAVAVLQLFYHWPLRLIDDEQTALVAKKLMDSTVMFWAILFSLTLLLATLPAFIALRNDIETAAKASGDTPQERKSWRDALGLSVISRDALGGALAILSPVLTAPVMEAFGLVFDVLQFGA